jgi:ABC-type transport system substrate-binding protein
MREKRRTLKHKLLCIGIALWLAMASGCLPPDEEYTNNMDTSDYTGQVEIPSEEKEAVILMTALKKDASGPLNPSGESEKAFYRLLFLNITEPDKNQNVNPSVALKWNLDEDLMTWRFVIAQDIYFHDGTLLTPSDVLFTLETVKSLGPDSPYYGAVRNIKSMEIEGNTLVIRLNTEDSLLPWRMNLPVISHKANEDDKYKWIGTGPFEFVSEDETGITLKKKDKEKLFFKLEFVTSEKDLRNILKPGNNSISTVPADEGALYEKRVDLFSNTYTGSEFIFISFNCSAQYMNRTNFRKALSCFLDTAGIVESVYGDNVVRAFYAIHPDSFLLGDSRKNGTEFDIEAGRELLKQENIPLYGGIYQRVQQITTVDAEGNTIVTYRYTPLRLRILVNGYDRQKLAVAEEIKKQLEACGIQTAINSPSADRVKDLIKRREYDILVSSIDLSYVPDPEIIGMLYKEGEENRLSNVCSLPAGSPLKAICEKTYKASNLSETVEGLKEVKNFVLNEVPYIGLGFKKVSCVYSRTINGNFGKDVFVFFRDVEGLDCK